MSQQVAVLSNELHQRCVSYDGTAAFVLLFKMGRGAHMTHSCVHDASHMHDFVELD